VKLQVFDGGVNSRLAPQLLQQNQGVVYENIDNAVGVLAPSKDKLATGINTNQYATFYEAQQEWVSSTIPTDYLEFQGVLYATDRTNRPTKYNGTTTNFIGIERPTSAPTLTIQNNADLLGQITALNDTTTGNLPTGELKYLLFNVTNGVYSIPYEFTISLTIVDALRSTGAFTNVPWQPEYMEENNQVITVPSTPNRRIAFSGLQGNFSDSARLYRFYDGDWYLVHAFTTKADTFFDDTYDISGNAVLDPADVTKFNGTYQYVYTYYNSADGTESAPSDVSAELELSSGSVQLTGLTASTDPQVTNKRIYRVGGNIAQFSLVAEITNATTSYTDNLNDTEIDGRLLESDNYYEAPTNLKYLTESYAMLFGAVGSQLRFTPIGIPNAWPPEFSIDFKTTITGIGQVANGLLVFTRTKTYIVTGTGPTSLSQQLLRGDQGCIAHESIQEANIGTLVWASTDGLCLSSGNDVKNITKFALGETLLSPTSSAVVDEVYYCHNSDGKTLSWDYRYTQIIKWLDLGITEILTANSLLYGWRDGQLYNVFKGSNDLTFKYLSPRYIEGSLTETKTYKKFYFRTEGDIIIKILIDDVLVVTKEFTSTDTHEVQVPQPQQRGYYVQFEVSGTGQLLEIEYVTGRRKND